MIIAASKSAKVKRPAAVRCSRVFDVLVDLLLVVDDPFSPALVAVGHAAEDDLRHLQARVTEAHWRAARDESDFCTRDAPVLTVRHGLLCDRHFGSSRMVREGRGRVSRSVHR